LRYRHRSEHFWKDVLGGREAGGGRLEGGERDVGDGGLDVLSGLSGRDGEGGVNVTLYLYEAHVEISGDTVALSIMHHK
jgi:hypothetical protein